MNLRRKHEMFRTSVRKLLKGHFNLRMLVCNHDNGLMNLPNICEEVLFKRMIELLMLSIQAGDFL